MGGKGDSYEERAAEQQEIADRVKAGQTLEEAQRDQAAGK